MQVKAPITRGGTVYSRLREDILRGQLKPGEKLRVEELRQRYDVGGSPVREALMRLAVEDFVVLEENRGFNVAQTSFEHLDDLTATRVEIEAVALRWTAERGDVDWEVQLMGAMHRLGSVSKDGAVSPDGGENDWLAYHRQFHRALVAGCKSEHLLDIRQRLFDQAERYVALSIAYTEETRDDLAEHRDLMNAMLERNVALAIELNRFHIERTTEKIKHSMGF